MFSLLNKDQKMFIVLFWTALVLHSFYQYGIQCSGSHMLERKRFNTPIMIEQSGMPERTDSVATTERERKPSGSPCSELLFPFRVDLNTAPLPELQLLPGIGHSLGIAIIECRERNGPFLYTEDVMKVRGIGEKKYARIKSHVEVVVPLNSRIERRAGVSESLSP